MELTTFIHGSAHNLHQLADQSVQMIATSPPYYGLRAYAGEQGVEWPEVTFRLNEWVEPTTVAGCDPNCAHEWGGYRTPGISGGPNPKQDSNRGAHHTGGDAAYCAKCGGWRGGLGMEPNPVAFIGHLILCLREWRRVLRDDGTIWVNLGDSYASGGSKRGGAYGISGTTPEDSQVRDSSSQSQRDAYPDQVRRTSRTDRQSVPMQAPSPSSPTLAHTESERGHLPTSDSVRQASRSANAIQGQAPVPSHANGQPHAFQESTLDESSLQLQEDFRQSHNPSASPFDVRSLPASTQDSVHTTASRRETQTYGDATQGQRYDTEYTEAIDGASVDHISGTASGSLSYLDYSTTLHHAQSNPKPKDLLGIPWLFAIAARADGWYLRSDIIWAKPNPMPESVTDRPTKSHEYVFLLSKSQRYFWDAEAVREDLKQSTLDRYEYGWNGVDDDGSNGSRTGSAFKKMKAGATMGEVMGTAGRNIRTVWTIATQPTPFAHFATWPEKLVQTMIRAGSSERGACPHCGKAWVRQVERTQYEPEAVEAGVRFVDESRGDKVRKLSGKDYNASVRVLGETWQPACTCPAHEPVPCVVLDPFNGSGTTGKVAVRLGRAYVGVDISHEYLDGVTAERFGAGVQIGMGL